MTTGHGVPKRAPADDEGPPFFGSWKRIYAAVLAWLAALIFFFYLFPGFFR